MDNDNLLSTMQEMRKNGYTHVPILQGDSVIGVFSENSIFQSLADNGITLIETDTNITAFQGYLPLKAHESEQFSFMGWNALLSEAEDRFEEHFRKNERLGMIFLTQNGKQTEKLMGILTAWDLLAQ